MTRGGKMLQRKYKTRSVSATAAAEITANDSSKILHRNYMAGNVSNTGSWLVDPKVSNNRNSIKADSSAGVGCIFERGDRYL